MHIRSLCVLMDAKVDPEKGFQEEGCTNFRLQGQLLGQKGSSLSGLFLRSPMSIILLPPLRAAKEDEGVI